MIVGRLQPGSGQIGAFGTRPHPQSFAIGWGVSDRSELFSVVGNEHE